ncbi:MAG: hypothetical protein NVS3B26_13270 [Mycobacteriales bacterium]
MIRKLTLAAGFAAGYVLGAKAGTQRYEQIAAKVRELAGMPAVQDVKHNLADTASSIADTAKVKVNDTISTAGDKVTGGSDVVDLGAATPAKRAGSAAGTPMAGAAPSVTAPDA